MFISSGTIHVFTVSGLHVGMLALLLFWLLRGVPFSTRHVIVPGLVFFYVLTTGMNPPAVRALLMISMWSLCRALLLYTPALNIVFFSASLLILLNPLYLLDIGFQFSFIVVSFLIASTRTILHWLNLLSEKQKWTPPALKTRRSIYSSKTVRLILASLAGCVVAWLASSGITLYYQGIYVPSAIFANLLIMPVVWLLFAAVFVKLVLHPVSWLIIFTGGFFRFLLKLIVIICGFFHFYFDNLPAIRPELPSLLIFYTALFIMVTAMRKRTFYISAAIVLTVTIYWHSSAFFKSPEITIFHGGSSNEPAIVLCFPAQKSATVINAPSWEAGGDIANYLKFNGISSIDRLVLCGTTKDFCAGGSRLLSAMNVEQLIIAGKPRGKYVNELIQTAASSDTSIVSLPGIEANGMAEYRFSRPDLKLNIKKENFAIEYSVPALNIKFDFFDNQLGMRELMITCDGKSRLVKLENSSVMEITEFVVDEQ
jgi:ComEC/Rec2-related protein